MICLLGVGARSGFPAELCDMANRLLSCEATFASIERLFSTLRVTYGLLRSELGVKKAGELTFRCHWLYNNGVLVFVSRIVGKGSAAIWL